MSMLTNVLLVGFMLGYGTFMLFAQKRVVDRLNKLLSPNHFYIMMHGGQEGIKLAKAVILKKLPDGQPLPNDPELKKLIKTYNIIWMSVIPPAIVAFLIAYIKHHN